MAVLPVCLDRKVPVVVATTGHTPAQKREIVGKASPQGVTGQGARQHGRGTLSNL